MSKYPKKGPFVSGVTPVDATCMNDLETYLYYAADSNITSNGSGQLTLPGPIIINNNLSYQAKDHTGAPQSQLGSDTLDNTHLFALAAGAAVKFRGPSVTWSHVDSTGIHLDGATAFDGSASTLTTGLFKLLAGSITRIQAAGPYSVTTTGTFFNHNLGVIPDFVLPVIDSVIGAAHAAAVDFATMTSTQVKLSSDLAGGLNVRILSFKF